MTGHDRRVPAEVRAELQELAAHYASAADRRDMDAFADCFRSDGELAIVREPGGEPAVRRGRDELRTVGSRLQAFARTFHLCGQSQYRYDEHSSDIVLGELYCVAHHITAEPLSDLVMYIRYFDRYALEGQSWKIASRFIHTDFTSEVTGVDDVATTDLNGDFWLTPR